MTFDDLNRLIERRENMNVDFKREVSEQVLQGLSTDLAAFANASGGMVIFGVTDSGDPLGCVLEGKERERISQEARNCQPAVAIEFEEIRFGQRHFLVVRIPKSNVVHSDADHRFPQRVGDTTGYLDALGIIMLLQQRGVVRSGGAEQAFASAERKREPMTQTDRRFFAELLGSEDPAIRAEALRDLQRLSHRAIYLDDDKIAERIERLLTEGAATEEANRLVLGVVRNAVVFGTELERATAIHWTAHIVKLAVSSPSAETRRAAFDVLECTRSPEIPTLLLRWVVELDEEKYSALQVPNMLANARHYGYDQQLRMALYDLLAKASDDKGKKRVVSILEALRQSN